MRRSTTPSINRPLSIACCMAPSRLPTPCLPPSVPYAPQDLTPRRYDPTKARALLEQAGWQQLEGQPSATKKPGNRWRLSWRLLAPTRWLNRWPKLFRPICGRSACRSPSVGEGGKQHLRAPARRPLRHDLQSHLGARPTIRMPF